jgi:phosphoribosylanthranilate isomerase
MFVKICGITTEEDALLATALGADAVGFIFAPSPRQVHAQLVHDIVRRLPPEILTVGVFKDEHPDRVIELATQAGVRAVQLSGHEPPEDALRIHPTVRLLIKAFTAGSDQLPRARAWGADIVMVDSPNPGSGTVFDWSLVGEIPQDARLLLAGGLTPENVATAIARVQPWGVDVASGVERSPGRKDPVKLRAFIQAARAAAPEAYIGPDELPYDWADE